jgi:hypothetical protein
MLGLNKRNGGWWELVFSLSEKQLSDKHDRKARLYLS